MSDERWQIMAYVYYALIVLVLLKIVNDLTKGNCNSNKRLDGQVIIVTGSSRGIGKYTALDLAKRGAKIILACNEIDEANQAKEEIVKISGNENVLVRYLDLGSFKSVRKFVSDIISTENRLDVLINNAGIAGFVNKKSEDGMELGLQVNFYGHFLLTYLLLDLLKKTAPSRVINVASVLHTFGRLNFNNLKCEKESNIVTVYSDSKLFTVIATREFSRHLRGTGVTFNCLHPGLIKTNIYDHTPLLVRIIVNLNFLRFFKTPEEGAQTSIHLAVSDDVTNTSGKYFIDCKKMNFLSRSYNKEIEKKFWERCCDLVALTPEERIY